MNLAAVQSKFTGEDRFGGYFSQTRSKIPRVVITGGPMAGKTTAISMLEQKHGKRLGFVPEIATLLLQSGSMPKPPTDKKRREAWLKPFQPAVLNLQMAHEMQCDELRGVRAIIHDRGTVDNAAYYPGGVAAFEKAFGVTLKQLYSAYDMVIFLDSAAVHHPEVFGTLGNDERYESIEEAVSLNARLHDVWSGHPNFHHIDGSLPFEEILETAISLIENAYINIEVERRWALQRLPDFAASLPRTDVSYLFLDDTEQEVRLSCIGGRYAQTIKSGSGVSRRQHEQPIHKSVFDACRHGAAASLVKQRITIEIESRSYTVDLHPNNEGLVTLECEFDTPEEARVFTLPAVLTSLVTREVTDDLSMRSRALAR